MGKNSGNHNGVCRYFRAITPQCTAPFSSQTSSSVHSVCCFWLLSTNLRDHSYITSAKDWVGGSRKWPVLLTFSNATIYSHIVSEWCDWVGVKKSPKLCWRNIRMIPKRMHILLLFLTLYASEYKWNYVCQVYGFYTSMRFFCRIFRLFWNMSLGL